MSVPGETERHGTALVILFSCFVFMATTTTPYTVHNDMERAATVAGLRRFNIYSVRQIMTVFGPQADIYLLDGRQFRLPSGVGWSERERNFALQRCGLPVPVTPEAWTNEFELAKWRQERCQWLEGELQWAYEKITKHKKKHKELKERVNDVVREAKKVIQGDSSSSNNTNTNTHARDNAMNWRAGEK